MKSAIGHTIFCKRVAVLPCCSVYTVPCTYLLSGTVECAVICSRR